MSLVPDERLARRVGAIALLVMVAASACFVFLLDRIALGSPTRIRVMFRHTAGLREHAALVVAGQPIGRIEAIVPVLHGAGGALAGEVGVAVTVAVDEGSAWKVPANAEIFVASHGPLSDKYLEVAPPSGEPGPAIHDGLELRGADPPSLDNILQHTWTNMTTFKRFVEAVKPELDALRTQLGELRRQLDRLANDTGTGGGTFALATEARALVAATRQTYDTSLGGEAGLARFRAMVEDARRVIALARAAIDVLGPPGAAIASPGRSWSTPRTERLSGTDRPLFDASVGVREVWLIDPKTGPRRARSTPKHARGCAARARRALSMEVYALHLIEPSEVILRQSLAAK